MDRAILPFLVASLTAGCGYLQDRGSDAGDIFIAGVSTGSGLAVAAAPTRFLHLEVGGRKDESFWGFRARRNRWVESSYGIPFSFFWSPRIGETEFDEWAWTDILKTSHVKTAFSSTVRREPLAALRVTEREYHVFVETKREGARLIDEFDVEVSASLLILGIDLGVSLGEFVDFLGGIFTLDVADDDESVVAGEPEVGGEPAATADPGGGADS